mmetsp:Transcript_23825/g.34150  ORF Transcript_23825/g.34150 Transcript_23825/m.34150 type:complete len:86 (-) Transcript_23825:125-382(-)
MKVHLNSFFLVIVLQLIKDSKAALGEKTRKDAVIGEILSASAQELREILLPRGRDSSYFYHSYHYTPAPTNSPKLPKHKKAKKVT